MYIFISYNTVVLFLSPQLLLQYLMQGFETCYVVQTRIGHVHEGYRSLIPVSNGELFSLNDLLLLL